MRCASHPIALGILVGIAIGAAILVVTIWFPEFAESRIEVDGDF